MHELNDLISKGEISNRPDLQFLLEKMVKVYPSIKDLLIFSKFRDWLLKLKEFIIELREFIYRLQKYNNHQEYFPFRFQRDLDKCVPTSLQMVYSSYNIVRDQCELYKEIGRETVKAAKNLIDYGINALLFKVFLPEIPNPDIFKEFFQLYMRLKQSRNLRCIFSIKSINKASEELQKQLDIQEEDIKHSVVFTGNQEGHHHCPTDGPEQIIKYKTLTGSFLIIEKGVGQFSRKQDFCSKCGEKINLEPFELLWYWYDSIGLKPYINCPFCKYDENLFDLDCLIDEKL